MGINNFDISKYYAMKSKIPDTKDVVYGEIKQWTFDDITAEYVVSVTLVDYLKRNKESSNYDEQLENSLYFIINNFVYRDSVEVAFTMFIDCGLTSQEHIERLVN